MPDTKCAHVVVVAVASLLWGAVPGSPIAFGCNPTVHAWWVEMYVTVT
jgi:ABC-type phosphate/phosphonate transport system permease subunit